MDQEVTLAAWRMGYRRGVQRASEVGSQVALMELKRTEGIPFVDEPCTCSTATMYCLAHKRWPCGKRPPKWPFQTCIRPKYHIGRHVNERDVEWPNAADPMPDEPEPADNESSRHAGRPGTSESERSTE